MLKVVEGSTGQEVQSGLEQLRTLDELAREGARMLLEMALQAEVEEYVAKYRGARGQDGRALVVRNGTGRPRRVTMGAGTVTLAAPR